jgi:hypothetical protein
VEPDHYVVGCLSFLLILERNTLTIKSAELMGEDQRKTSS